MILCLAFRRLYALSFFDVIQLTAVGLFLTYTWINEQGVKSNTSSHPVCADSYAHTLNV